ncbi:acylphosphatase [Gynurincola endophyticus]|uniref:acylphosphatase n=1 Tax=Gynurincola endophyticus TaxID=2479004 RepID=UPI000F8D63E8|nr:acylphosphatase [Gynurincola endophyticus]
MQKTIEIIVSGLVQGVMYRKHTTEKALSLDLKGWVKNLSDGTVILHATGTEDQLNLLIEWCKEGSPKAVVDNLVVKEIPLETFSTFQTIK